jgi:hypothetical protein
MAICREDLRAQQVIVCVTPKFRTFTILFGWLLLRSDFLFVLSVFDTIYASSLVLSVRCASHNTASRVFGRYGVVTAGFPYLLVLELCTNGELLKHVKKEAHTTYHLLLILKDIAAGMT